MYAWRDVVRKRLMEKKKTSFHPKKTSLAKKKSKLRNTCVKLLTVLPSAALKMTLLLDADQQD